MVVKKMFRDDDDENKYKYKAMHENGSVQVK